ncbi:MAG: hypothetical protein KatS3mg061_0862 [Dehalococcoidia bacterium]|nr:MAG: hypothetical protein KatS3mg061_0862 [Dehalococcoidia bacterium]
MDQKHATISPEPMRRLPIALAALIAALTVVLATVPSALFSASQDGASPLVGDPAATELGRARQVAQFAARYQPDLDPLIRLADGRQVKASNYRGVLIDGVRYYYTILGHYSADPLARGEVGWHEVAVKERIQAGDDFTIVVYTIPR